MRKSLSFILVFVISLFLLSLFAKFEIRILQRDKCRTTNTDVGMVISCISSERVDQFRSKQEGE